MSEHNQAAHRQRLMADQILDRVASDPTFHQQLLDNTALALQAAGFAQELAADEVVGYAAPNMPCNAVTCGYRSCGWTCLITCFPSTCKATSKLS